MEEYVRNMGTEQTPANDHDDSKIGMLQIWAIGLGSALGGVFFGWQFILYGGFFFSLIAVAFSAYFYWIYSKVITELSVRYQSTGGSFDFVYQALGIRSAIVVAIMSVFKLIFANAATSLAVTSYLSQSGWPHSVKIVVCIGLYLLFTTLDCVGIRQSSGVQIFVTSLCVVIIIIFFFSTISIFHFDYLLTYPNFTGNGGFLYVSYAATGLCSFLKGLPFAMQFFDGFEEIPLLISYVKRPEVIMPGSILLCYVWVCAIAFLVLIASSGSTKINDLINSEAPLMEGIEAVFGYGTFISDSIGYLIVLGLVMNFFAFTVFTSQQIQAIAEAGLLPHSLSYRDVDRGSPVYASLTSMVIGIGVTLFFSELLGEDSAQNTLLVASMIPNIICYIYVLQCIVVIRGAEYKKEHGNTFLKHFDQLKLGYHPKQFHVQDAIWYVRVAQIMCALLLGGLLVLALSSFDYAYGVLVTMTLGLLAYIIIHQYAKESIHEEDMLSQQDETEELLSSHENSLHGDQLESDRKISVPRDFSNPLYDDSIINIYDHNNNQAYHG